MQNSIPPETEQTMQSQHISFISYNSLTHMACLLNQAYVLHMPEYAASTWILSAIRIAQALDWMTCQVTAQLGEHHPAVQYAIL